MRTGAENRKKTIAAGALGAVALVCIFIMYNSLFGGTSTPPPTVAPINTPAHATRAAAAPTQATVQTPANAAHTSMPGVDAVKLASTSASLDPTLDEAAMHRTENLVYSGTGRNIFSLTYTPPPPPMPSKVPSPRPKPNRPAACTRWSAASSAHQPQVLRHGQARERSSSGLSAAGRQRLSRLCG